MEGGKSSSALTIQACEEQLLRSHIMFVAAGKTNLTDEQTVDLLLSAFPQSYSSCDRKLLTERVAKITALPRRRDDAIDEDTNKRQKVDETLKASGQNVALVVSDSTEINESESDEIDGDRRKLNENGEGRWRNGSRHNFPMFWDVYGSSRYNLKEDVIMPLHQFKLLRHFGVKPRARILLHGPPGCGKTMLARAIANEAEVPFYEISAAALVSGVSGEPEENIRELFSTAHTRAPCIVFIDEIDAMTSKTGSLQKAAETHIIKQLIACMDKPYRLIKPVNHDADSESSNSRPGHVLVIGATNKINALDPALRQWFDREFAIAAPDEKARLHILSSLTCNFKVDAFFDLATIARCTLGFVAGDLIALVKKAGKYAVRRTLTERALQCDSERSDEALIEDSYSQPFSDEDLEKLSITMTDFWDACQVIRPSSEIADFSIKPTAKWDDVVGHQLLKSEFERHIIKPIKFPEVYKKVNVTIKEPKFFLYGPPGCGKTMIVEALANEAGAHFMHIKAEELYKYEENSGWMVQNLYHYAGTRAPCILFFDQFTRCGDEERLNYGIHELIIELGSGLDGVYVIGATNRIEVGEHFPLIRRRFQKILSVPLPTPKERAAILKILARDHPIDDDVDLVALGKGSDTYKYTGRDLSYLVEEAAKAAICRGGGCSRPWTIKQADFKIALDRASARITHQEEKRYKRYYKLCEGAS